MLFFFRLLRLPTKSGWSRNDIVLLSHIGWVVRQGYFFPFSLLRFRTALRTISANLRPCIWNLRSFFLLSLFSDFIMLSMTSPGLCQRAPDQPHSLKRVPFHVIGEERCAELYCSRRDDGISHASSFPSGYKSFHHHTRTPGDR
jgi:hypothetical protein